MRTAPSTAAFCCAARSRAFWRLQGTPQTCSRERATSPRWAAGGGATLLLLLAENPGRGGAPRWADSTSLLGCQRFRCSGRAGLALDLRATAMNLPRVAAPGWWPPFPRGGRTRLFSQPVLLVEAGAEVGNVLPARQNTPPLPLPRVLVAQG